MVLGYGLEYWTHNLRRSILQPDFGVGEHLAWMASAYFADLLLASWLLIWLWFTHHKVQKHPALALVYIMLGTVMPIYSMVVSSISVSGNSPSFVVYFYMAPLSLASFVSAFIAFFGLQRLIFRQSAM